MEYKVIDADNSGGLEEAVGDAIAEGWRPLGGLSVITVARNTHGTVYNEYAFFQAMIKEPPIVKSYGSPHLEEVEKA